MKKLKLRFFFGNSKVSILIEKNRLILVGYNGIEKTTVLNIFCYFISQQWANRNKQNFTSLSLYLENGRVLTVDKDKIKLKILLKEFDDDFYNERMSQNIREIKQFLSENIERQILYLPTYRRIEQDIKTVFSNLEGKMSYQMSRLLRNSLSDDNFTRIV